MTEKELYELFEKLTKELKGYKYDIPVVLLNIDFDNKRTYGYCERQDMNLFVIHISKSHYLNAPYVNVMKTLLHELTHAIDRNINGHNATWRKLAKEVGSLYNVEINRTLAASEEEIAVHIEKAVAYMTCKDCGLVHLLYRKTKAYKTEGSGYVCGRCRGEMEFKKLK